MVMRACAWQRCIVSKTPGSQPSRSMSALTGMRHRLSHLLSLKTWGRPATRTTLFERACVSFIRLNSSVYMVETEATQLQLRQAKGWVRDWMPHTGTLCITIPQHNSDAQHMRGRLGTHTTCSMGVGQGAWKGDGQAQKERTHTCNTHSSGMAIRSAASRPRHGDTA